MEAVTQAAVTSYPRSAILPALGQLRVDSVVRADVARFFHEYGQLTRMLREGGDFVFWRIVWLSSERFREGGRRWMARRVGLKRGRGRFRFGSRLVGNAQRSATLRDRIWDRFRGRGRAERGYPAVSRCTRSRNTPWSGQALDNRTATVRVFRVTTAPILSSRRRRVWHCARARSVPRSAVRRTRIPRG